MSMATKKNSITGVKLMTISRLALYGALCCFGINAYANEASIVIPNYGGGDSAETHREKMLKAARSFRSDETKKESAKEPATLEKNKTVTEKNRNSPEKSKIVAEKNKTSAEKSKTAADKSKTESEKQRTQNKKVYSYVNTSNFKSPVGANSEEEALRALNKDIDKAEQDASKPFLNHISGKITNRPAPTCKIGEHQKKWWCESTVTFSGQTYSDPAKEKQATHTTKVQER